MPKEADDGHDEEAAGEGVGEQGGDEREQAPDGLLGGDAGQPPNAVPATGRSAPETPRLD